jgi:predicted secreted acid phosphatase
MTNRKTVVICDIDGTIANNNHRQHWLKSKPSNWKAYNATMSEDLLIKPVATTIEFMRRGDNEVRVIYVSGREEVYRDVTEKWLNQYSLLKANPLYMRPEGDYRGDEIVKKELLYQAMKEHDFELEDVLCIFDDRPKVVRMWRELGLFVFDCNQTGEEF